MTQALKCVILTIIWYFIAFFGYFMRYPIYKPYHDSSAARTFAQSGVTPGVTMEALGQSDAFLAVQEQLARAAPIDRPVLIIGERGTGKELAATRLHYLSGRWQHPLVTLNCATLAPSLMEAALFGHEKGAFTGAVGKRRGRFEAADKSTLFLDEIGNIPMQAQEKILRVVEYGSFERVGGTSQIMVDVRVIGATNADLPNLSKNKEFKQDLLDRLSFEVIFLPPLRERAEDVLLLANHFARQMALELNRSDIPSFSRQATAILENHAWPGNIRELKNVVERAVYRSHHPEIDTIDLDPFQSPYAALPESPTPDKISSGKIKSKAHTADIKRVGDLKIPFKEAVKRLEIDLINQALVRTRYHQKKAAGVLGLTYGQLRGLLRKYHREFANAGLRTSNQNASN